MLLLSAFNPRALSGGASEAIAMSQPQAYGILGPDEFRKIREVFECRAIRSDSKGLAYGTLARSSSNQFSTTAISDYVITLSTTSS